MRLVVVLATLFFIVLLLLLLALPIALFGLKVLFPQLVRRVAIQAREDNVKDVRVPCYGLAFDAFFDVLCNCQYTFI